MVVTRDAEEKPMGKIPQGDLGKYIWIAWKKILNKIGVQLFQDREKQRQIIKFQMKKKKI